MRLGRRAVALLSVRARVQLAGPRFRFPLNEPCVRIFRRRLSEEFMASPTLPGRATCRPPSSVVRRSQAVRAPRLRSSPVRLRRSQPTRRVHIDRRLWRRSSPNRRWASGMLPGALRYGSLRRTPRRRARSGSPPVRAGRAVKGMMAIAAPPAGRALSSTRNRRTLGPAYFQRSRHASLSRTRRYSTMNSSICSFRPARNN